MPKPAAEAALSSQHKIVRLAHQGDGVTETGAFVAFSAPGDVLSLNSSGDHAQIGTLHQAGPDRVTPHCPHFGRCGGCQLQHLSDDFLAQWKRAQIAEALKDRGINDAPIGETFVAPPKSRRRATFSARLTREGMVLGFHERESRMIADMQVCSVLREEITRALPAFRDLLLPFLARRGEAQMHVLSTQGGLDLALGIGGLTFNASLRAQLAAMAEQLDLARLTVNDEAIVMRRAPVIMLAGVPVVPPAEGFLQASAEAETRMQDLVCTITQGARKVADLFCGCGTFTFALAKGAPVFAADSEARAIAALTQGARGAQGLKPITAERRDLFRRPVLAHELNAFDAVVYDPPRAGAKAQTEQIAESTVKKVAAISCNPATFARDARLLMDKGFRLSQIWPIDQFRWSAHVELVAAFERA